MKNPLFPPIALELCIFPVGFLAHWYIYSASYFSHPLPPSFSALWWKHHIRQWDHLLPGLSRGVSQLSWLLLADHRGSWLRHQTKLHPASGSWSTRLHHCLVRNDFNWNYISICFLVIAEPKGQGHLNKMSYSVLMCHFRCNHIYLCLCHSILFIIPSY